MSGVEDHIAYLASAAREFLALQRQNPGRNSPGRERWNWSQALVIDKGVAAGPDEGIYRNVLSTRTLGHDGNIWGALVLDATILPRQEPATQGWSRLRAKITWGIGGITQTAFCDWGSQIVQVPLQDVSVDVQYGPAQFVSTPDLDRPLGDNVLNEPPFQVRAALLERIRPQPVPVNFTYAWVPNGQVVTVPPFAKGWHAIPAVAGGPGFGVGTTVQLLRSGIPRAEWIYPYNPSTVDGNMPGSLGQHGPDQIRGTGDAQMVINDPNGNTTCFWFDIAL